MECPTCGKRTEWKGNPWRPFCSERCKLIDFDKWTSEEFRMPGISVSMGETVDDEKHRESSDSGESN